MEKYPELTDLAQTAGLVTVPVKFIQGRWFEFAVVKLIFLFTSQPQKANGGLSSWADNVDIRVCESDNLRTQQCGRFKPVSYVFLPTISDEFKSQ